MAQMRQKIAIAKRNSGQPAADDFAALTAIFAEVWTSVMQAQPASKVPASGIAALEYRERSLFVRLKPEGEAPTERMKAALADRDLALTMAPAGQTAGVVWQIRSNK